MEKGSDGDDTAVQACMNIAASLGATLAPLIIGGLTRANPGQGWRNFYVCEGLLGCHAGLC